MTGARLHVVPVREESPANTVTLLFSDIEGSTRLLQDLGSAYSSVLRSLREIIRTAVADEDGREIDTAGDGFFAAFPTARGALAAAARVQHEIATASWPAQVRVRIGIHTGEPELADESYVGVDVHRAARICSAAAGGQILVSNTTRTLVTRDLPEGTCLIDLGRHRLKDLDSPEHLFELVAGGRATTGLPLRNLADWPGSLPAPLTTFVGREREIGQLVETIGTHRLVTLTGPGGAGKTRLAIAAADRLRPRFGDGVIFVGLASSRDISNDLDLDLMGPCCIRSCGETCELFSAAAANALGVKENPMRPIFDSVRDAVRHRELLIILDNFEQLLDAAYLVSDLLAESPQLSVVVTSRSPLHLSGEQEFSVPPLSLPQLEEHTEQLARHDAVQLFIERARSVRTDFELTSENARAVAEICVRLDGLPLAIELAAARTKVLSPHAILRRLNRRLQLLTGGGKDLPERHQTLRQAIAWSYDLLRDDEKACFRRLSAFVVGFTLEAAEFMCGRFGDFDVDVLDVVSALVDKSLLRHEDGIGGEPRFTMLESIRDYGRESLEQAGEVDGAWRAHAEYFLQMAEGAEPHLVGKGQVEMVNRLEGDHENFRAALTWAEEHDEGEIGLRIAAALCRYWMIRGHLREGRERLERLLAVPSAQTPTQIRARALNGLGTIVHEISDYRAARTLLEESHEIWKQLGDRAGMASVLNNLSWIAVVQGDLTMAVSVAEESLLIHREKQDRRGTAVALHNLAVVAFQEGRYMDAHSLLEEAIQLRRTIGDERGIAYETTMLALLETFEGKLESAAARAETALSKLIDLNDRQLVPWACTIRGHVALRQGHYEDAVRRLENSVALWRDVGNRGALSEALTYLAAGLCRLGRLDAALSAAEEAVELARWTGARWYTGQALSTLADILRQRGDEGRAAAFEEESRAVMEPLRSQRQALIDA